MRRDEQGSDPDADASRAGWRRRPILQALGAGSALSVAGIGRTAADDRPSAGEDDSAPADGRIRCNDSREEALTEDDETGFRSDRHYHDTYTFEGTVGDTIFVDMWTDAEGTFPYLYLLDPNGNVVAEGDEGFEWDSFLSYDVELAGEYTIVATSVHEETFFEYGLFVSCFRPPAPIECGETVRGSVDDVLFESQHVFQARARDEVTIGVTADDEDADPYLMLLDPDWNVVAQDDDSGEGRNPLIEEHLIQRPGQYTILVASYWDDAFEYELELACEEGPPLETESVECGDVVSGALTEDDETGFRGTAPFDAYSFSSSPDTFLAVSMTTDGGDPYLYLLDPDGNVVAEDDDSGGELNSLIAYRTETGGEYTVIATSLWGGFGDFPELEDGEENDGSDDPDEFPGSFFEYELELVCCSR